jgi:hypothetical protein
MNRVASNEDSRGISPGTEKKVMFKGTWQRKSETDTKATRLCQGPCLDTPRDVSRHAT